MTDISIDDPCVVFAMNRESMFFRNEFRPQQAFAGAPCWARFCGPSWLTVLVVHAGVGVARMQSALAWLLAAPALDNVAYQPKLVLSAGFAGGLQDQFAVGDIILADAVTDTSGQEWPTSWPSEPLRGEWQPPIRRGRIVTAAKLIGYPDDKRKLAQKHNAVAVDMESAVLADKCSRAGIPFGCVRVISDDVRTELSPRLVSLLSGATVSPTRLTLALLRSPGLAPQLWRLQRNTRYAAQQLAKALGELLTLTLPWSQDLEEDAR